MVSATKLSSYLYCPRKLFISSVLKVEEPPKEALVKGKIWHKTYEFINKNDEPIVKSIKTKDYTTIYDSYKRSYAKFLRNAIIMSRSELEGFGIKMLDIFTDYWPHFDSEAKLRAVNLCEFISKQQIFGDELWNRLEPKILSEKYFKSEKLGLSGIIDMIEVYNHADAEFYVPVEIKTGKVPNKGMWDGHRVQLASYMMLLEDAGMNTGEGYLKYKGVDDKRILSMNSLLKEEIIGLISKVSIMITTLELPNFTDNKNKCISCVHKKLCYNEMEIGKLLNEARNFSDETKTTIKE